MQALGYREHKERGTFEFPLEFYHVDLSHPQYAMPFHWHMEYEIIRILEGEFDVVLDDSRYFAKAGDVLLITDGILHAGTPRDCIYECIVFDCRLITQGDEMCRSYMKRIVDHTYMLQSFYSSQDTEIHDIVWSLFEKARAKGPAFELMITGELFCLFGCILNKKLYTKGVQEDKRRWAAQIKGALSIMEESYGSLITLEQLSKAAGMSPKYFCSFFHNLTDKSPMEYLNHYRIEQACSQLAQREGSITEIAYRCGFNDLSYFIKTFKRYKGMTPKKYELQHEKLQQNENNDKSTKLW